MPDGTREGIERYREGNHPTSRPGAQPNDHPIIPLFLIGFAAGVVWLAFIFPWGTIISSLIVLRVLAAFVPEGSGRRKAAEPKPLINRGSPSAKEGFQYQKPLGEGRTIHYNSKDGLKDGNYLVTYPDGQTAEVGQYVRGCLDGFVDIFAPDGRRSARKTFRSSGLLSIERFHPNGTLRRRGNYLGVQEHDVHERFDSGGRLVTKVIYDKGNVVRSQQRSDQQAEDDPGDKWRREFDEAAWEESWRRKYSDG